MRKIKNIQSEKLNHLKAKYLPDEKKTSYIVVAVFIWASWATLGAIRNNYNLQTKVDELNEKIVQLQIDNERLEFSNEYYDTDEYLDLAARQNLNKIAPGERILVVPERDDQFTGNTETVSSSTGTDRSNFSEWLNFLFSIDI